MKKKILSITEIASELGMAHPSINSMVAKILRKGYLKEIKDKNDGRRRLVKLSKKGEDILVGLIEVWHAAGLGIKRLLEESEVDMMADLDKIESRLKIKGFHIRTIEELYRKVSKPDFDEEELKNN